MIGLTKTVAREWGGFNIRCNAVTYGYIATRLTSDKDSGASISVDGQKARPAQSFVECACLAAASVHALVCGCSCAAQSGRTGRTKPAPGRFCLLLL